jgi:hypothetical protein
MLRDAMLDTARRVVSARRVVQYQNEIGVLAHLWYNALTTGLGTQTLGEEYCDLFQIDPRGAAPGATRRWALVFLDAFAQPAMRRVRVRARAAADRRDRGDVRPRAGDDVETIRADDDEETSTSFLDAFSRRTAGKTLRRFVELADAALVAAFAPSPDPERPEPGDPTRGALVRGHLAIFFATGAFFSFAHRFANVRFAFVGTEGPEGRPRLGLLGYLLAAQLAYATVADGRAAWRAKVSNAESGGSENARRRRRAKEYRRFRVRDARGGRFAIKRGGVFGFSLFVVSRPEEVRSVLIPARRARGDAVRTRLLLGVRRELVRAKTGVPVVQSARRAAVARARGGVVKKAVFGFRHTDDDV